MAGIIAARADNGLGTAGLAPQARILPVKVLGDNGDGWTTDVAAGVIWAADNGASIVNLSLGSPDYDDTLASAITYARSRGVVVVAAGGNEYSEGNPREYPAGDYGVIGVGATTPSHRRASFSNTGDYLDVAAPGDNIVSTCSGSFSAEVRGDRYCSASGTSMATPFVSATAALIRQRVPSLSPDQVELTLQRTASDFGFQGATWSSVQAR